MGLTCRVGRAVPGSANLLQDLVRDGGSLLLIGPPGVGKTTVIRYAWISEAPVVTYYNVLVIICDRYICRHIMVIISE